MDVVISWCEGDVGDIGVVDLDADVDVDVDVEVEDEKVDGRPTSSFELVLEARIVEYAGSYVPLMPMQSTLKDPMLMLVQSVRGTTVPLLSQYRRLGGEYVVTTQCGS